MKSIIRFLLMWVGLLFGLVNCKPYQVPEFDKIIFEYRDSISDETFNNGFTITIMPEQSIVVVKASKKSIANRAYQLEKGQFERIKAMAKKIEEPGVHHQRKPGSASKDIQLLRKERVEYRLFWDDYYQLEPTTQAFERAIKALIPNLDKLLKAPQGQNSEP